MKVAKEKKKKYEGHKRKEKRVQSIGDNGRGAIEREANRMFAEKKRRSLKRN